MRQKFRVLLVGSKTGFFSRLKDGFEERGIIPWVMKNGADVVRTARFRPFDLLVISRETPGFNRVRLAAKIRELQPDLPMVFFQGPKQEAIPSEVEKGREVVVLPPSEEKVFWDFVRELLAKKGISLPPGPVNFCPGPPPLGDSGPDKQSVPPSGNGTPRIIGDSPGMREVRELIGKVAALDCTVLISGETGTGKELVARAIHGQSARSANKFLAINCGSFGQDILNNELFGYERESVSGKIRIKNGVFEAAQGGTIFLDEICETPAAMQSSLLRVLEDKMIIRSGGTEEIPVDVRILASTNQRLRKKMEAGQFRSDLYFRLNSFVLRLPPLRERSEDIPPLANYFLSKYCREFGRQVERMSGQTMHLLSSYPFPGNVRDLEHAMERAIIMCEGPVLLPRHLPRRFQTSRPEANRPAARDLVSLEDVEKEHIQRIIRHTRGNKNEAAKILGISRTSLWRKLKKYGQE